MSAMSEIPETDDHRRRKRLRFRAWHRGMREADLILGPFADTYLEAFEPPELDDFEALLAVPDHDLHDWLTGREAPPLRFNITLIERIRAHAQRRTS
jgi:antitoxin CptB